MLTIRDHYSSSYGLRTRVNAASSDLTAAFAVRFDTPGERLTRSCAEDHYIAIPLWLSTRPAARRLYRALRSHEAFTLNIAGNSLPTLLRQGIDQDIADEFLFGVLRLVHELW